MPAPGRQRPAADGNAFLCNRVAEAPGLLQPAGRPTGLALGGAAEVLVRTGAGGLSRPRRAEARQVTTSPVRFFNLRFSITAFH